MSLKRMKSQWTSSSFKGDMVWHVLFLDVMTQSLRFGGMSVLDILIHSLFLSLATAIMLTHRQLYRIPNGYLVVFAVTLGLGLLQTVPLPEPLFAFLAPVKHRVVAATSAIFPNLEYTTQITMVPALHWFRLASLTLDMYLICLALMAPLPSRKVFRFWLLILSFTIGMLATLRGRHLLDTNSILAIYRTTFGGLVNRNHLSVLAVILMALLVQQGLIALRDAYQRMARERPVDMNKFLGDTLVAISCGTGLILVFTSFRLSWSRAGILNFCMAGLAFGFFYLIYCKRFRFLRSWRLSLGMVVVLVVLFLFFPFGKGLEKMAQKGFAMDARAQAWGIAYDYFAEAPILGLGLGATESVLPAVEARFQRVIHHRDRVQVTLEKRSTVHFHNEYLETLIELGPIGLIALLVFIVIVFLEILESLRGVSFRKQMWMCAVLSIMVMLVFYSLLAFPLRITSIRIWVLTTVFLCVRHAMLERAVLVNRFYHFGYLIPILLVVVAYFSYAFRLSMPGEHAHIPQVVRAKKYGSSFQEPFYVANRKAGRLLTVPMPTKEAAKEIQEMRWLLYRFLKEQPFSIKALNLLFILETFEFKMNHPDFEAGQFEILKGKALAIGALAKNANIQAKFALYFLYELYAPFLSETEEEEYRALQTLLAPGIEDAVKNLKN